jgi:hypothetical protein
VVGQWGVRDVVYALIHELGGTITPKVAKALKIPMPDGSFRFVKSVTIRPAVPAARGRQALSEPRRPHSRAYDAGGRRWLIPLT